MFKFIHAADLHLDSQLIGLQRYESAPVDEIRGATRRALENLVTLAIDEEAAFVLIAGDLYDGDWKDYNTALFFGRQMNKLRERGIRVFVISGNHDAASVITRKLNPPANVTMISQKDIKGIAHEDEARGVRVMVFGHSFSAREELENVTGRFPQAQPGWFNIGMLHTSAERKSAGSEQHTPYAPCSVADLASKGYDYWALGHVHKRTVLCEDPWMVFPGNTQGRHARETGPKGCTLVTVDDRGVASVEHRDLDVVRWCGLEVDVTGARSLEDVFSRVADSLNDTAASSGDRLSAVRLSLVGACKAHEEIMKSREELENGIWQAASGTGGVWIEKIRVATRTEADLEALSKRDDATGELLRSIRDVSIDDSDVAAMLADDSVLKALFSKLPPAVRSGEDPLDPDDPESLRQALEDARQILITSIFEGGDRS